MKRYDSYKNSGVAWIGEIPEHWSIGKLKHFSDKVTDGSHHSPPTLETGKRYLSVKDIGQNELLFDDCKKISNEEFELLVRNGCQPIKGDILLTKDGTIGRAAIVGDDNDFVVLSSLGIIRPNKNKYNSVFLREWLVSDLNIEQMLSLIQGSALRRITITIINNLIVTLPPKEEQDLIANYLENKTTQLDNLISKKKRLIELLKEERTAIINQAVTKGLDLKVPMKDSGIEWLGEIPEHWEMLRMKNLGKVNQGLQISIEQRLLEPTFGSLPYITIKNLNSPNATQYYVEGANGNVICQEDDILVARTGATGQIVTNVNGVFHNNFFLFNYNRETVVRDYLYHYLLIKPVTEYLLMVSGTNTIPDLNHGEFYNTPVLLPPIEEQERIIKKVNSEAQRIDELLEKMNKEIDLLKEYKTALISEVVTGKVDVRDEVI